VSTVDALARAGWARLLPAHRADGDDQPVGVPRLVGTLPLGGDRGGDVELAIVLDDRDRVHPVPLVTDGDDVRRAVPGDGAAEALVRLVAAGDLERDGFRVTSWQHRTAAGERAVTVDQTNESVVVGEAAVVKWAVVAEEGPHPAPSLLSALDAARFTGMPRPWGVLEWEGRLLALVVDLVPGAVDGWTWAVEDLSSLDVSRAEAAGAAVGDLVARFHRALAGTSRPATPAEVGSWRLGALEDLDRALAVTRDVLPERATEVRALLSAMPTALDAVDVAVQRVHGDLHLGQVLRSGDDYVLTDFDGNPVVPASERVRAQPVVSDVAGMAQSWSHAGIVVRRHHPHLDPDAVDAAAAAARSAFLAAYGEVEPALLRAFALRQVCREFTYAATHLPRWTYVPQAALPMLLQEEDLR
jgi:maltokinase